MNRIKLSPIDRFNDEMLCGNAGHSIVRAHLGSTASRILHNRGLGYINRLYGYGVFASDPNGYKQLLQDRMDMQNGNRETYLLSNANATGQDPYIGIATINLNHETKGTARAATVVGRFISTLSKEMTIEGPEIAAWAGDYYPYTDETNQYEILRDAYTILRNKGGANSWSVEPKGAGKEVHQAIMDAGLSPSDELVFYDNFRKSEPVYLGILYQ